MVRQEELVHWVQLVPLVHLEIRVLRETLALGDLLGLLAHKARGENQVAKAGLDPQVSLGNEDPPDPQDPVVYRVTQAGTDLEVHRATKVPRDL